MSNRLVGGRRALWVRWIIGLFALGFAVFQFVHASHLAYKEMGPGTAFGAHSYYSRGGRAGGGWNFYVHVHVDSQHRTVDTWRGERTALYGLVSDSSQSVPLQQVEVDRFTNEISRVQYNGAWLNAAGRQSKKGLLTAGILGLVVALVCLGLNLRYLLGGPRTPSSMRFGTAT